MKTLFEVMEALKKIAVERKPAYAECWTASIHTHSDISDKMYGQITYTKDGVCTEIHRLCIPIDGTGTLGLPYVSSLFA